MAPYTQTLFSYFPNCFIKFLFIHQYKYSITQLNILDGNGSVLMTVFSISIPIPGILIYIDDMNEKSYCFI